MTLTTDYPRALSGAAEAAHYRVGVASGLRMLAIALTLGAVTVSPLFPSGTGSAKLASIASAPLGGVNIVGPEFPPATANRALAAARALHARVVRIEIRWSDFEPEQGRLNPRIVSLTDRFVAQAAAEGLRIVALVEGTPCWASSAPASLQHACRPGRNTKANAWPPSNPDAYGSFVAYLATRYASSLAAIEVWNEPDQANEDYFAGPNKAMRYAAVLRAAYTAIKRTDPSMQVLGASIVGSNGAFLKALYAAGIKGYYDGLSVHFYNLVLASLRSIHEVQLANGDTKPVWLNEFGWSSCWPRQRIQQEQGCVTRQAQAANLQNTFRSLARTPWVAAEIVYELQGPRGTDFGVLTQTGAHKPSFAALGSVLSSPFGRPSPITVRLARRQGRVTASGSGPVGDYMQLEAFRGSTLVYRALFTLNRFNRYSIALPRILGTSKIHVRVFQYWMGSARAAHASI